MCAHITNGPITSKPITNLTQQMWRGDDLNTLLSAKISPKEVKFVIITLLLLLLFYCYRDRC